MSRYIDNTLLCLLFTIKDMLIVIQNRIGDAVTFVGVIIGSGSGEWGPS